MLIKLKERVDKLTKQVYIACIQILLSVIIQSFIKQTLTYRQRVKELTYQLQSYEMPEQMFEIELVQTKKKAQQKLTKKVNKISKSILHSDFLL